MKQEAYAEDHTTVTIDLYGQGFTLIPAGRSSRFQ